MNKHTSLQIVQIFFFSLLMVSLSGCSTTHVGQTYNTKNIEFQVLKPATIPIPTGVYRYGIVYIQKEEKNEILEIKNSEKEILHENARKSCLNGMYQYINNAETLDTAIVLEYNSSILNDSSEMFWTNMRALCSKNNIDALVFINRLKIENAVVPVSYQSNYQQMADLKLKTTWTVLFPEEELKIEKDIDYRKLGSIDDGKDQFIYNAGEMTGVKFGKHIIPGWTKTEREYFIANNTDFKSASEYIEQGDWDSASKLWSNYLNSENKNIAAKANFNLALYYEIQGNLDKAFELAKKADITYKLPLAHTYAGILHHRIKDQYLLAEQLK